MQTVSSNTISIICCNMNIILVFPSRTCDNLTLHVVFFKHAFEYPHYLLLDSKLKLKSTPFLTQTDVHRYFDPDIYSIKLLCVSREEGLSSIQLFNLTSDLYYVQVHSKCLESFFFPSSYFLLRNDMCVCVRTSLLQVFPIYL